MIELKPSNQNKDAEFVRILIVGVGGAGSNVLDRIVLDGIENAEMVVMNTDAQSLTSSVATGKVQLGRSATRGLGAGGDPEIGALAAEESTEEIREAIEGASLVLICAGLGGGTGSGSAPMVARLAREQGALVVAFATMPFTFEGRRRRRQAEEALAILEELADVVICFENDRMGEMSSPRAGIHEAFANADQTISQSARAVCDLVHKPGLIHIGFDDLIAALRGTNTRALFGYGIAEGENRAHESLERALKNPLMEKGRLLSEANNVLVSVTGGTGMTLAEVQVLMEELNRHVGDETRILFGVSVDTRMGNRMSVTILSCAELGTSIAAVADRHSAERAVSNWGGHPRDTEPEPFHAAAPAVAADTEPEPQPEPVVENEPEIKIVEEEPEEVVAEEEMERGADAPEDAEERLLSFDFAGVADAAAASEPDEQPVAVKIEEAPTAPHPVPPQVRVETASRPAKAPQQETLQFEPVSRGRFEKSEPTIIDGEDLDVPTFLRRNVRMK